ncbi:MAG: hypothetical protein EXS51_04325 [Candidatus Taylorbacteria bacterium]|nr:hypothetical protein [Candidatus Taylorbacteria bacterium]
MATPPENTPTTPPAEARPGSPAERPKGMVEGWTPTDALNSPGFVDFLSNKANYLDADSFSTAEENVEGILERWNDFLADKGVKRILQKPKFEQFLTRFKDSDQVPRNFQGAEKINERLALFEDAQATALGLKKIHQDKLRANRAGSLSMEEVAQFQDYAENLAVTAPNELLTLKDELKAATELPVEVKQAEKEYELAKVEQAQHQKTVEISNDPKWTLKGFRELWHYVNYSLTRTKTLEARAQKLSKSRESSDKDKAETIEKILQMRKGEASQKELRRIEGDLSRCAEMLVTENAELSGVDDAVKAGKELFRQARESIFSKVPLAKEIHQRSCDTVQERLGKAMSSGNLGTLEGALKEIQAYEARAEADQSENYFSVFDATGAKIGEFEPEELRAKVQEKIEETITKGIVDKLSMIRAGATPLKMEGLLRTFVQKVKTGLGIKGKEEAWDFLMTTLRVQEGMATGPRKLLLTHFISIIEAKKAEEEASVSAETSA